VQECTIEQIKASRVCGGITEGGCQFKNRKSMDIPHSEFERSTRGGILLNDLAAKEGELIANFFFRKRRSKLLSWYKSSKGYSQPSFLKVISRVYVGTVLAFLWHPIEKFVVSELSGYLSRR